MSAWTVLGDGVSVRRSRCFEMNTLVAQRDGHTLLIDPGVLPSELDELVAMTQKVSPDLNHVSLAFTHPHWDHVLGLPWFPGAETFAHAGFHDVLEQESLAIDRSAREELAKHGEALPHPFRAFEPLLKARGTTRVTLGPFALVTYDTPGHDPNDYAIGKRRALPIINIMYKDGSMNAAAGALPRARVCPRRGRCWCLTGGDAVPSQARTRA